MKSSIQDTGPPCFPTGEHSCCWIESSFSLQMSLINQSIYRQIFVYTFCLINIPVCLSLSDDANKIKTLNIERA